MRHYRIQKTCTYFYLGVKIFDERTSESKVFFSNTLFIDYEVLTMEIGKLILIVRDGVIFEL